MQSIYTTLQLNEEERALFYNEFSTKKDLAPVNSYVLLYDENDNLEASFVQKEDGLREVKGYEIPASMYMEGSKPRNDYQRLAVDMLMDKDSKVKVLTGVFGSGKSHLGISAAMSLIDQKKYRTLIWVRNSVEVKGVPRLGALPGDLDAKLAGWTAVLADKVGGFEAIAQYQDSEIIKVEHLGTLRGRDFKDSIVYMTEGQNMTGEIAKLLLGRIGEGSMLIIDGDFKQTDNKMFESDNGLNLLVSALKGNRLFAHVDLPISERSEVAALANVVEEWQNKQKMEAKNEFYEPNS